MNTSRYRILKDGVPQRGPVVYWMSRDQRFDDNWALIYAQEQALQLKVPLVILFVLVPEFLGATARQYGFMLKGLESLAEKAAAKKIGFILRLGDPRTTVPDFVKSVAAGLLVKDFDPLRIKQTWTGQVCQGLSIPVYEVDAHNIVPCWMASPKQEYGAYTIRPKIHRVLDQYLDTLPRIKTHPEPFSEAKGGIDAEALLAKLEIDRSVPQVDWILSGEKAARKSLRDFIKKRSHRYAQDRNDPNKQGQSDLSPYLHFGQLSAQRVALEVLSGEVTTTARDAFLEELIVRRELSDNFCFYNKNYDSILCLPAWARTSLEQHQPDARSYIYTLAQLERGQTHDDLWNAAQQQMVLSGKMHGYMRMYWAKKILEWTRTPQTAFKAAIYLNDKYELDGRDPNGYAGIAWSLGGLHDRAWGERAVFGKVRYMSFNGCRSKFDVAAYIQTWRKGEA